MVGMPCSIADTVDEAMETLSSGTRYFLDVLGGGIRTAQRLVLQKTRYYREEAYRERFPGLTARRETPLEELMENLVGDFLQRGETFLVNQAASGPAGG